MSEVIPISFTSLARLTPPHLESPEWRAPLQTRNGSASEKSPSSPRFEKTKPQTNKRLNLETTSATHVAVSNTRLFAMADRIEVGEETARRPTVSSCGRPSTRGS